MILMPYWRSRPPSQSSRPLQSGAAARTTDLPLRSDRVATLFSSAYFLVTKNALVSVAAEGLSRVMPARFSSGLGVGDGLGRVGRAYRLGVRAVVGAVEELEDAADVLGDHVDALGEHLHVDVAGADQLDVGCVAGLLQYAGVQVGDDTRPRLKFWPEMVTTPATGGRAAGAPVSPAVVLLEPLPQPATRRTALTAAAPVRNRRECMDLTFCVPRSSSARVRCP